MATTLRHERWQSLIAFRKNGSSIRFDSLAFLSNASLILPRNALRMMQPPRHIDRKSTRLNSSHYLNDALPIYRFPEERIEHQVRQLGVLVECLFDFAEERAADDAAAAPHRSEEHTSELQSLPQRRSSDLSLSGRTDRASGSTAWRSCRMPL